MTTPTKKSVTYLGKLKDLYTETTSDGDMLLRITAGQPGFTYYATVAMTQEMTRLLSRAIANYIAEKPFPHELVIDLARVRYLNIIEIDGEHCYQDDAGAVHSNSTVKIRFELGGMSNTFLGVEALTITVDYHSLANLLPNHESILMRERYKKLGWFRQWLWRRLLGKDKILGLPGVKF